jgi:hypothetical protein
MLKLAEMLQKLGISGKTEDRTKILVPNFFLPTSHQILLGTQNSNTTSGSDFRCASKYTKRRCVRTIPVFLGVDLIPSKKQVLEN